MRAIALAALFSLGPWDASPSAAAPEGRMTWAVHVSLAPTWCDPAATQGSACRVWSSTRSTMRS